MGWTGTIMYWGRKATNKDLFLEAYPSYKRALDEGRIKLSQKGSNVFMLFQCDVPSSEHYGKYGVIEFLCRREPNEFMTKDIDAVDNLCFGFPKSWCDILDKSDPDVQKYLAARAEFEAKEKSKCKPEIGDVLECVASREISWSDGHSIAKGEKFYVTVGTLNPWSAKKQKAYIQARPGTVWNNGYWSFLKGFVSEGLAHHFGFMRVSENGRTLRIDSMGIVNGGACGDYDFHTTGKRHYMTGWHRNEPALQPLNVSDIETMLKMFDNFESRFYSELETFLAKKGA